MSDSDARRDWETLLRHAVEGSLRGEDEERLAAHLRRDPELIREYVYHVNLEAMLSSELYVEESPEMSALADTLSPASATEPATRHSKRRLATMTTFVAAAILLLTIVLWSPWRGANRQPAGPEPSRLIASLVDTEDATWPDGNVPSYGDRFRQGETVALESGTARLAFDNGVAMTLQGPCRLELSSPRKIALHAGNIHARIPESADPIEVVTPSTNIVGNLRQVGLVVDAAGETDVHVFDGVADVRSTREPGQTRLTAQQAGRFPRDFAVDARFAAASNVFGDLPTLEQIAAVRKGTLVTRPGKLDESTDALAETDARVAAPPKLIADDFDYQVGDFDGSHGGEGFGDHAWRADVPFAEVVAPGLTLPGETAGQTAVALHGRDPAYPSIANRIVRKLPTVGDDDLYISFLARYDGLDRDDFFSFWLDDAATMDSSHSRAPNVGIRFGWIFARLHHGHEVVQERAQDGATYWFVAALRRSRDGEPDRLELWMNPRPGDRQPADVEVIRREDAKGVPKSTFLGFRMGQHTEPHDRLLIDRLRIGPTFESVTSSTDSSEQGQPGKP
ncbi:FecR protein [Planctomycetes bacterium Pan216]|uniref:FecR protein n=1 Tax=Kolteria novifilia TaxID=2527975 RepID=A0A518B464_9BACT|nr:FecR protein [Planctomycetes bacterium Pan216]